MAEEVNTQIDGKEVDPVTIICCRAAIEKAKLMSRLDDLENKISGDEDISSTEKQILLYHLKERRRFVKDDTQKRAQEVAVSRDPSGAGE